jgi:transcriptional regulator with XRE-family HTH domain
MVDGLGKLIVKRRRELRLSQQDLARKLGVPAANLSQLEHSASRWRSRLIPALAEALQVSQLELALAAGIIDDLPPFPSTVGSEIDDDPLYPNLLTTDGQDEPPEERLVNLLRDLSPKEIEFLVAVTETFLRRQPGATGSSSASNFNGVEPLSMAASTTQYVGFDL